MFKPRALSSLDSLKEKSPAALAATVATVPVIESEVAAAAKVAIKPPALNASPAPASIVQEELAMTSA